MRVFASRNLGHGVRVGVSQSVGRSRRPVPRTRGGDPVINGKVVKAPPVYRWLLLVICVSGGVGLVVFPPILVVTGVAFVFLLAAQHRWTKAQKVAAQDHRPPVGTLERQAYDARAARIAELDRERAIAEAAYAQATARAEKRFGHPRQG